MRGRVHFDPPRSGVRRVVWWWVAAALVIAGAGVWWWWWSALREVPLPASAPLAAVAASAADRSWQAIAPHAAPPASPALVTLQPQAIKGGRVEVCGLGLVDERELERLLPEQASLDARQRLADALLQGSEREQMVGRLLQLGLAFEQVVVPTLIACGEDLACRAALAAQPHPQIDAVVIAMIELTERSADPWLYQAAIHYACSGGIAGTQPRTPDCLRVTPAGWLTRDPGNAAPWLLEAERAAARRDAAGAEAALRAASLQPTLDSGYASVHGPLLANAGFRALAPVMRLDVMMRLWGVTAAVQISSLQQIVQHCRGEALERTGRREECGHLARLLTGERVTQLQHAIGTRIAGWVGWPAERLRELEDEKAALVHWQSVGALDPARSFSCEGIQRYEEFARDIAAFGEVEAVRRQLKVSGRSIAPLAAEARQRRGR